MTECECADESGPCEEHCKLLSQREGASLRTADELALVYIDDAQEIDPECLSPYGKSVVERVNANMAEHDSRWITDDPDLADELYSVVDQVENYIGPDYQTYRDDGYRIVKITGGPLLEDQ